MAVAEVKMEMEMEGRIPQGPATGHCNLLDPETVGLFGSAARSPLTTWSGIPSPFRTVSRKLCCVGNAFLEVVGWQLLRVAIHRKNGYVVMF